MAHDVGRALANSAEDIMKIIEEEEQEEAEGSTRRTRKQIVRNRMAASDRLMAHYFNDDAVYDPAIFRRRFGMHKPLFLRIVNDIENVSSFIRQSCDARGAEGFTPIQKCATAIRQLAYGCVSDSWDEYFQMSERVVRESLDEFCECVIFLYRKRYLRKPTITDVQQLYAHHAEVHGFPGMLGSLDCMHWDWGNCLVRYQGQYARGGNKHPTLVLEVVASQDLWIWHAYFGAPGCLNDINILGRSPLFDTFCNGSVAPCSFTIRDRHYRYGYYLVDGIYPDYAVFAKPLRYLGDERRAKYATMQKRARKDIERTFGVLKKRWRILDSPARPKNQNKIENIMYTCIILHNMILEYEGKTIYTYVENEIESQPLYEPGSDPYLAIRKTLHDSDVHHYLRNDLAEHLWFVTSVDLNTIPEDDEEDFSDLAVGRILNFKYCNFHFVGVISISSIVISIS